ncbi:MAG: hypothetical protein R3B70_00060 [Polyangiaceae bacterium]
MRNRWFGVGRVGSVAAGLGAVVTLAALLSAGCDGETQVGECSLGGNYYEPGCAEGLGTALEVAGCYAPCPDVGKACEGAGTCKEVVINPCPCEAGETCCDACGSVEALCVP